MATYYIATTGNDSTGDGSSALPWLTISKAHTAASSGDTIRVKDGTYNIAAQTFTKSLTVTGNSGVASLVTFQTPASTTQWIASSVTLNISYLTFLNVYSTATQQSVFNASGTSPVLSISNCVFKNCYGTGSGAFAAGGIIGTQTGATNIAITVSSCMFINPLSSINAGIFSIYTATGTFVVTGCTAWFTNSGTWAVAIFTQNAGFGTTVTIKNCIFHNATGGTVNYRQLFGTNATYNPTYSDFYSITSSPTGTGIITSDPLFVDATNSNFNLRPSSPCIDTGSAV